MPEALKPLGVETEPESSVTWSGFWTNFDVNKCMVPVLWLGVYAGCAWKYASSSYITADFRIFIHICQDILKIS